jgi:hypothetical protein
MRRQFVAVIVTLSMVVSACGLQLPDEIDLPTQLTGNEPKTLEAATTAAQEVADRLTSGDFAGVWLMLSKQVRDNISQADYVTLQNACTKTGLPARVTGVRLDSPTTAIVRWNADVPGLSGFKVTKTMVYEDGKWVEAPDPEYVQDYGGLNVEQIIAKRISTGHCSKSTPPTSTAPSSIAPPTISAPPLRMPATSDAHADRNGGTGHLVAVRLARNDGYDRIVLEFADQVPSYTVGYRPLPAHADASGDEIPLPGASALVQITLTGATGSGWSGDPQTYFGPSTVTGDTAVVTEAKAAGDFEAVLTWVVGLRSEVPFSVLVFAGPPRLAIDFVH